MSAYALIMAGGGGTRLWPASRRRRPKQFLPLLEGDRTLLGATIDRIAPAVPAERILIVTAADQVEECVAAAPSIPRYNIVVEPAARNTAGCIGLGAVEVVRRDPAAVLAVVPSDQYVADAAGFRAALERALRVATAGGVVTIGIKPTGPETGFGYVALGAPAAQGAYVVDRFVEKPDRETAAGYVASGRYLWNSGMFFFSARRILDAIDAHLPELGALLSKIARDPTLTDRLYPTAPAISVDYGVMERLGAGEVFVVPGDFGWSDVGAWSALGDILSKDAANNATRGESVAIDANDNILYADCGRVITAVGVSGLVVVATEDAVLVLPRERAQDVREVVKALESTKRGTYL